MAEPDYVALKAPQFDKNKPSRLSQVSPNATLEERCRAVIVANLEQYSTDVWGVLSEPEWESVVQMRHIRTAPQKGQRRAPSISERYIGAVEDENPHLSESAVVDKLVWKDIVELKYPISGLARPRGLQFPWPILVQRIIKAGSDLLELYENEDVSDRDKHNLERAIQVLHDAPMNVALLQETGIGKTLKKFIKASTGKREHKAEDLGVFTVRRTKSSTSDAMSPVAQLEGLLESWKEMAAQNGVDIQDRGHDDIRKPAAETSMERDLRKAASCQTWRDLYRTLHSRETKRRTNQGVRMRQRREQLAQTQPKIVKVRPASHRPLTKRDAVSHRPVGTKFGASSTKNKMEAIREESKVAASWAKSSKGGVGALQGTASAFGNAVAFCSVGKSAKRMRPGATKAVALAGGKRMKVPTDKIPANTLRKKLSKPIRR